MVQGHLPCWMRDADVKLSVQGPHLKHGHDYRTSGVSCLALQALQTAQTVPGWLLPGQPVLPGH